MEAYSWMRCAVCAGCNTPPMVEAAVDMVAHVFLAVAVLQWVVVFPKRGRYCLNIDAGWLNRVAVIVAQEVQRARGAAIANTAPSAQWRGVICAPHWGGPECICAFAPVRAEICGGARRRGRCFAGCRWVKLVCGGCSRLCRSGLKGSANMMCINVKVSHRTSAGWST